MQPPPPYVNPQSPTGWRRQLAATLPHPSAAEHADEPHQLAPVVRPAATVSSTTDVQPAAKSQRRPSSRSPAPAYSSADDPPNPPPNPPAKSPKDTHHEMSANTKNSVQRLTALSNLKDDGKVVLPPSIQDLSFFKDNGIDVTEQALTKAVQSLKNARTTAPTTTPEETTPTTEGMSTVVSLSSEVPSGDAADADD